MCRPPEIKISASPFLTPESHAHADAPQENLYSPLNASSYPWNAPGRQGGFVPPAYSTPFIPSDTSARRAPALVPSTQRKRGIDFGCSDPYTSECPGLFPSEPISSSYQAKLLNAANGFFPPHQQVEGGTSTPLRKKPYTGQQSFGETLQSTFILPSWNEDANRFLPSRMANAFGGDAFDPMSHGVCDSDEHEDEAVEQEKKVRRMMSNRASAKRSRQRRQQRLEELEVVTAKLRMENGSLFRKLSEAQAAARQFQMENLHLKMEVEKLKSGATQGEAYSSGNSSAPATNERAQITSPLFKDEMPLTKPKDETLCLSERTPVQGKHDLDADVILAVMGTGQAVVGNSTCQPGQKAFMESGACGGCLQEEGVALPLEGLPSINSLESMGLIADVALASPVVAESSDEADDVCSLELKPLLEGGKIADDDWLESLESCFDI